MNVLPFVYLRLPEVDTGAAWHAVEDRKTWGGNIFPDSAMVLKCEHNEARIEIQESRDANSLRTLIFGYGTVVAILGNSLIFFEGDLRKTFPKSLEEI